MNTQLFWIVNSFAIALVDIYIAFSFFDGFFMKREVKKVRSVIIIALLWIFLSIMSVYGKETTYLILSLLSVNIIIAMLFYRGKIIYKIFSASLLICLSIATEAITFFSLVGLNQISTKMMQESLVLQVEGGIISKIILLLVVKILCSFIAAKLEDIPMRFRAMLFMMPVASVFVICQIVVDSTHMLSLNLGMIMISVIGILYINIVTFVLFEEFIKQAENQLRLTLARQQLDIQIAHYRNLQENRDKVKSIWHDMKNHLLCIENLAAKGSTLDTLNYVKKLNNSTHSLDSIIDSGNPVIDSIIEEKTIVSKRLGIELESEIMIPADIMVDPIDICIILGNALDNAIEANERLLKMDIEKKINLNMSYVNSYLTLSIRNPSNPCNPDNDGVYHTSKNDKGVHGFGIQNIRNTLNKYNGNMKLRWEDDVFYTDIVMFSAVNISEAI